MASVSAPARPRPASAPPAPPAAVRHGKCGLHLSIGGTRYRLHPLTPPAGFKVVWSLRKQAADHSATYQVAVEKGQPPACTCPDHEINGAVCKHIGALKALGLIPGRKARPAAARRAHARRLAERARRAPAGAVRRRLPVRRPGGDPPHQRPGRARAPRRRGMPLSAASRSTRPSAADPHFCGPCAGRGCAMSTSFITSLRIDRAGLIRPDLIPLAAFLCAEEYDAYARSLILDHAAAGAPLDVLTAPTPDGWVILEPADLAGAEEAAAGPGGRAGSRPAPVAGGAPSLADLVAAEAGRLRRSASPIAGFLADQLERLAQLVAFTGAGSPGEYADRIETEERDRLAREYDRGFEDGRSRTAGYCPR